MKINLPINNFKLVGNKVFVDDLIVEYEDISEDTREILESLISKGAYGSALLTLNMFYNVKAFNESSFSKEDYLSYLGECNKLLKECVVEIDEAHNFKPLINLDGLEIMENAKNIARGKGDKMLIEDFRKGELLQERYLKSAKYGSPVWHTYKINDNVYEFRCTYWETRGGWGHNVILSMNYDQLADVDVRYYNRTWEMWEFQTAMQQACSKAIKSYKDLAPELEQVRDLITQGDKGESSEMRRTVMESEEGTQTSDIAEKKDQEVGSLQKPKKHRKLIDKSEAILEEMKNVPRNHGFKGFMLDESGFYTRGNYVLIKEGKTIKAINRKSFEKRSYIKNK